VASSRNSLPLALLAGLICFTLQAMWAREYYGASVPFGDEFEGTVGFLASVRAGQLNWHLMFEPHLEHRIPVLRAFFLLTYWVFGETSFLAYLLISAALMGAIVAVWVYTLRRLREPLWLIAATVFVAMSRSQYHNMLWPFQVEFYTLVGSVVAAICWIALAERVTWLGVIGCAAACAISLYSIASGVTAWAVVGMVLFLRTLSEHRSLAALLRARRAWLQMGLFVALGVLITGAYFYDYAPLHPARQTPRNFMQFITWLSASLVYPIVDVHQPSEVWWLPLVVAAVFVPIAAALWLYWRRRDTARLVIVSGLVLNVVVNMAIIAAGRAAAPFIAPRYGTVALWTSVASLVAIASLIREAARSRWRWTAAPALVALAAYLLVAHARAYSTYTREMEQWGSARVMFEHNILAYVIDGSPARKLAAFLPHPAGIIQPMLDDATYMSVMPYNLRPPARMTAAGDAWSLDVLPPALPHPPDTFVFGSGTGADTHTGTVTSTPFFVRGALVLSIAGYPTRAGNSLAVEAATDPGRRVVFSGPDPGMRWSEWRLEASQLPARRVRIVAVDGAEAPDGWLAVGMPADKPASVTRLEAFASHVEWWTAPFEVALLAWIVARARRQP
jgi:hypothetical protein